MTPQFPWSAVCLLCLFCSQISINESVQPDSIEHFLEGQTLETWPDNLKNTNPPQTFQEHSIAGIDGLRDDSYLAQDDQTKSDDKQVWPFSLAAYRYFLRHISPKFFAPQFARHARGRLGRMPIAFGKRELPKSPNVLAELALDGQSSADGFNEENDDGNIQYTAGKLADAANSFQRVARQRLNRMPFAFGKRMESPDFGQNSWAEKREFPSYENTENDQPPQNAERIFQRLSRTKLNRMPFAFGKRDRLNRMPFTFGKRDLQDPKSEIESVEGDMSNNGFKVDQSGVEKRSRLNRMPLTYGKRGRLGRMPIAFGKRNGLNDNELRLSTLLGDNGGSSSKGAFHLSGNDDV